MSKRSFTDEIVDDVWLHIVHFLTIDEFARFRQTCNKLNQLTNPRLPAINKYWKNKSNVLFCGTFIDTCFKTSDWCSLYFDLKHFAEYHQLRENEPLADKSKAILDACYSDSLLVFQMLTFKLIKNNCKKIKKYDINCVCCVGNHVTLGDCCKRQKHPYCSRTPINIALNLKSFKILQFMIDNINELKIDVHQRDFDDNTLLLQIFKHLKSDWNSNPIVLIQAIDVLIDKILNDCDKNKALNTLLLKANITNETPFIHAAKHGRNDILLKIYHRLIRNNNIDHDLIKLAINFQVSYLGKTAYIFACENGDEETIKTLINKYKVDVSIRDSKGNRGSWYLPQHKNVNNCNNTHTNSITNHDQQSSGWLQLFRHSISDKFF